MRHLYDNILKNKFLISIEDTAIQVSSPILIFHTNTKLAGSH